MQNNVEIVQNSLKLSLASFFGSNDLCKLATIGQSIKQCVRPLNLP